MRLIACWTCLITAASLPGCGGATESGKTATQRGGATESAKTKTATQRAQKTDEPSLLPDVSRFSEFNLRGLRSTDRELIRKYKDFNRDEAIAEIKRHRGRVKVDEEGHVVRVTDVGNAQAFLLQHFPKLSVVWVTREFNEVGLKEVVRIESLEELYLDFACISDVGARSLVGLKNLKRLNLTGTAITSAALPHLGALSNLEWLNLMGCAVEDTGFEHVGKLQRLRTLTLSMAQKVGDNALRALRSSPELRSLHIGWTQVSDDGLVHLRRVSSLETLSLAHTKVTANGVQHLRELPSLKRIILFGSAVGDDGMQHIADLAHLQSLNLGHTAVGDTGIAKLAKSKTLSKLWLGGTKTTAVGLRALGATERQLSVCLDKEITRSAADQITMEFSALNLSVDVPVTPLEGLAE